MLRPLNGVFGVSGDSIEFGNPACDSQSCSIYADPHISGCDNVDDVGPASLSRKLSLRSAHSTLRSRGMSFSKRPMDIKAYDAGDFWLVRSSPIEIQGRFRLSAEFVPGRAAFGAIAVGGPFLNGSVLIVRPMDGVVTLDGQSLEMRDSVNLESIKSADGHMSISQRP